MRESPINFHSIANVAIIEQTIREGRIGSEELWIYGDWMVKHAHPDGGSFFDHWQDRVETECRDEALEIERSRIARARAAYDVVRQYVQYENLEPDIRETYYKFDNGMFFRKEGSRNLLVVWSSMYNNFGVSHAVTTAMLRTLDCHVLLLKDGGTYGFLAGVKGLANSLREIGPKIAQIAARIGADNIYFTGYSSGTMGALATSLTIDCKGYVAFSQRIGLADDPSSVQYLPGLTKVLGVDAGEFLSGVMPRPRPSDLRNPRVLFVGAQNAQDQYYAKVATDHVPCRVIVIPDVGHNTVPAIIASGTFLSVHADMMASRPGVPVLDVRNSGVPVSGNAGVDADDGHFSLAHLNGGGR